MADQWMKADKETVQKNLGPLSSGTGEAQNARDHHYFSSATSLEESDDQDELIKAATNSDRRQREDKDYFHSNVPVFKPPLSPSHVPEEVDKASFSSLPSVLKDHNFGFPMQPSVGPKESEKMLNQSEEMDEDMIESEDNRRSLGCKEIENENQSVYCICQTSDVDRFMMYVFLLSWERVFWRLRACGTCRREFNNRTIG